MNSWGFVGWQTVERADGAGGADRADMSIDHGGTDVGVAEQFLDGSDVDAVFEQMGGEAMSQTVAAGSFCDAGLADGFGDGALYGCFVNMVSSELLSLFVGTVAIGGFAGSRVTADFVGRKDVLPSERSAGGGIFVLHGVGEPDPAGAGGQIAGVLLSDEFDLSFEGMNEFLGEGDHSVLFAFAVSDGDLEPVEVDVFDAESAGFHESESAAVHESGHDPDGTFGDRAEDASHFIDGEDDWESFGAFGADGVDLD